MKSKTHRLITVCLLACLVAAMAVGWLAYRRFSHAPGTGIAEVPVASAAVHTQPSEPVTAEVAKSGVGKAEDASAGVQPNRRVQPVVAPVPARIDGLAAPELSMPVDTSLVAKLVAAGEDGREIGFPLPGGGVAKGTVEWSKLRDGVPVLVQGKLTAPRTGFFFFQIPPQIGVAGEMVGIVRFDEGETAYRVEPGKDGKPELAQRDIDDIMCRNLARQDEEEHGAEALNAPEDHPLNTDSIPAYQNGVVSLQSLPGATGVLYLDFDGEKGPFASWGSFDAAHSGLNNTQIRATWEHVAEDFAPFNVNVTTDLQVFLAAPETSRQRCIISPSSPVESGVAFGGTFNWGDVVCWAGYRGGKTGWEVTSHELGHTMNLGHDGRTAPAEEYYGGAGNGEVGWAPIMGNSYYKNLTQWSKGEYPNPTRTQDDLAIITANNNVDYRADDHGNDFAAASYLEVLAGDAVSNQGIIETGEDLDAYRFTTTASGNVSLTVRRDTGDGNLDILAEIVRASDGVVMASDNPDTLLDATVTADGLAAGTYFLRVSGVGRGLVSVDGYSDYGSLGHYKVSGTVPGGVQPDRLEVAENSANGTVVGSVTPRNNHGAAVLSYAIASGNGLGAFRINSATGQLTVASSAALNYESLSTRYDDPATIELFVNITNGSNSSLNETVRVIVSATDVNEAHIVAGPSAAEVFRNAKVGTPVANFYVDGTDQFDTIAWSITSGNASGAFAISANGQLTVANSTALAAQGSHVLEITGTDNGPPAPVIAATHSITVNTSLWNPGDALYLKNWTQESGVVASQSSTYSPGVASRAIDGNTNGNWGAGSVTHTNNVSNSWWEVDLGSPRAIALVQLFNRTDGVGTRLSNFRVSVLDGSRVELAGQDFYAGSGSVAASELWTLTSAVTGRYVRVQLLGNNNDGNGFLSLAEVIVSDALPPNVALASGGAVATQSTTYQSAVASRAIDGNTDGVLANGSVTHTNGSPNDWWQVNLGAPYSIGQIAFYNRAESPQRLTNFKVSVWNGATEVYSGNYYTEPGTSVSKMFTLSQIEGVVGDRVKIEFLNPHNSQRFLSLAEVQVYASAPAGTLNSWSNAAGGSWSTAANWLNSSIASGADKTADFSTLNLTANSTVTLDGARAIGGLTFGDTTPSHNWTLNSGSGGPLTLSVSSGSPVISVANQTATIGAVLAGSQGLVKSGVGTLALTGVNSYTGATSVSAGTLQLGDGTIQPTLNSTYDIASAAILRVQYNTSGSAAQTWSKYTGAGTLALETGKNFDTAWGTGGLGAGFTGTLQIEGGRVIATNAAGNGLGGTTEVVVKTGGQLGMWNGGTFNQNFTIEGTGYGEGNGYDVALRFANNSLTTTLNGTIALTGNATIGARGTGIGTLNGVISGTASSGLAFGTSTLNGKVVLTGNNTYTGTTAVNGGALLVNGSLANSATTVAAAGTLGGSGTLAGVVTNNGTLAPGSAGIGTLTVNNTLTLGGDSNIEWQINDWTGAAGAGWDKLTATSLNLTATSANPVTIRLSETSLANFTETSQTFILVQTTGGITGFSADKFAVDDSALTNPQGTWIVQQSGNNLVLAYTRYNTAPAFGSDPILVGATEDAALNGGLVVNDPDIAESLTFEKISGPAWLVVSNTGNLSGTPSNSDVGVSNFTVRVFDSMGGEDIATLSITVANVNDAPGFTADPINLSATEDSAFSGQLAATDVDAGDSRTYVKISGPAWLTVSNTGTLSGTPLNANVGANAFTVRVTDGAGAFDVATLNITVTNVNDAPAFTADPINLGATEDSAFSGQLAATDVDAGDSRTYVKISGPAWLTVSNTGALAGTPTNANVGANAFVVRVTDTAGAFDDAALNITVTNANDAPVFTVDPILAADATIGTAYTGQTLAGKATDADAGDSVTYLKVSGPAWLGVAQNGSLTGTPPAGSAGLNTFVVRATDGSSATDDAELRINVAGLPLPWTSGDIGTGMLAGSASYSSGTFTLAGSGVIGGFESADKLQYTYQSLTGDGEIIARVSSLQNTGASSRVGVMIRDTLAPNSRRAFFGLSNTGDYCWERRFGTGGNNISVSGGSGSVPNTWVRLVRSGSKITAYKSSDGITWTTVTSGTVVMASNCYIGLVVSSGSDTTLNTSQFSNVSVTP